MKKILITASLMATCFLDAVAAPQATPSSTVMNIEKIKKEFSIPDKDNEIITQQVIDKRNEVLNHATIQDPQNLPQLKTEVNFDKVQPMKATVLPDIPDIEKFHQVKDIKKAEVDITAMLEEYQHKMQISEKTEKVADSSFESGRAYLFVSSSMPPETLRNLMHDASRLGVTVFFNGNIDENEPLKFSKMKDYLAGLNLKSFVDLKIHPPAFTKFKITQVPAIVIASEHVDSSLDESGCANPKDFDIIRGDVKLDWAIEKIYTESKSDEVKAVASQYIEKINASKIN